MNVCFVTDGSLLDTWRNSLDLLLGSELIVYGFNGLGLVNYEKELKGESENFQDLARLSKELNCTIVCGSDTENFGEFRHSVIIAENGKILGVSDMVHSILDSEFVAGGSFRVYDTKACKLGILVCEDLFFQESSRILSLCDCDIIISIFTKVQNILPINILRASSYFNGVNMVLCANNFLAISNYLGEIELLSRKNIVKRRIKLEKNYQIITSKKRGVFHDFSNL